MGTVTDPSQDKVAEEALRVTTHLPRAWETRANILATAWNHSPVGPGGSVNTSAGSIETATMTRFVPTGAVSLPSDRLKPGGRVIRTQSPSDLSHLPFGRHRIGARVVSFSEGDLLVCDALRAVRLEAPPELGLSPGDFVIFELETCETGLRFVELLRVLPHPEPRGDGEAARLQHAGRGKHLAARSRALRIIRSYFEEQGFVETETPTFVPSPGLDPHVHSLAPVVRQERIDHLITSPEFHMKRLLVGGMPRIYQLARCFRAEELGSLHEPEFTLLEWYRAFAQWEDIASDTEEIVVRVFETLQGSLDDEPERLSRPFVRITVRDAFREFAGVSDAVSLARDDPTSYFDRLSGKVEPGLKSLGRPVFLTHYPMSQAALARPCPADSSVAERFELYVDGVELSNGFSELTDVREQRRRFEAEIERRRQAAEPLYPLDERFLAALEEGLPPSAGNALGVDRLVALALGASDISQTLAFSDEER